MTNPSNGCFRSFAVPLQLSVKPSVVYRAVLTAGHGLLGAVTLLSVDNKMVVASVFALCLLSLAMSLRYARHPLKLVWCEDGSWQLQYLQRAYTELRLGKQCVNHPWLVSLVFEGPATKPPRIVIPLDSVPEAEFRRLRVRLKAEAGVG